MPKATSRPTPDTVRIIRGVFKAISIRNRVIGDVVEPTLKGMRGAQKDKARVQKMVKLFKTNPDLRDALRADLRAFGIHVGA